MKTLKCFKKIFNYTAFVLTISVLSLFTSAIDIDFTVEDSSYVESEMEVSLMSEPDSDSDNAVLMASVFEGEGTIASPYIINTADELLSIPGYVNDDTNGKYKNGHYKLACDIDLNGAEWTPIGTLSKPFAGSFDGNNKTVSNFKITNSLTYAGFFGFIYNASITNLNISNVNVKYDFKDTSTYFGVIVGRAEASYEEKSVVIKNCHVTNSEINISSNYRIYGSGHSGYLHCSNDAKIIVADCTTDAVCNFTLNDQSGAIINSTASQLRSILRVGGLLGYCATKENGTFEVYDCHSNATVISDFKNIATQELNDIHIGAFAGEFTLTSIDNENKSELKIERCYSTNMVYTNTDGGVYAGGFIGYLVSQTSTVKINDCHSNSNVYAQSKASDSYYLGGFLGLIGLQLGADITIENCYAVGNVIALNQNNASRGRRFVPVIVGEPVFNNCYALQDSMVIAKKTSTCHSVNYIDTDKDMPETVLSANAAAELVEYSGFDINVWENGEPPYKFPVLSNNKLVHGTYAAYYRVNDNLIKYIDSLEYGSSPSLPETNPESNYIFSHWSTYPGNPSAPADESFKATSDVILFPNDTTTPKSYTITFISRGNVYDVKSLEYNTKIELPSTTPESYESIDKMFKYTFSHWSAEENGVAISNSYKISGEKTLYAVFQKLNINVWDGITTVPFSEGNGTASNPYQISNPYQMAFLSETVNSGKAVPGSYYSITADINLGDYEWSPIGTTENPFIGFLDANGYSIYNFKITSVNTKYAGLFGYVKNSNISNLDVTQFVININSRQNDTYYVGGIAAHISSDTTGSVMSIVQSRTNGNIAVNANIVYAGGIAGSASEALDSKNYIQNSYSECNISVESSALSVAGGIVSNVNKNNSSNTFIAKVYNTGVISAKSDTTAISGGIIGLASLSGNHEGTKLIETSFYTGNKVESISNSGDSYSGAIYGQLKNENENAGVNVVLSNCIYPETASIIANNVSTNESVIKISDVSTLYDSQVLTNEYGFDCDTVWQTSENSLPKIQNIVKPKNKFIINKYDIEGNALVAELTVCFADINNYLVLVGVYNARGKMIGFDTVAVSNASESQEINFSISNVSDATTSTISFINPSNLQFIRAPQFRIFS